MNASPSTSKRVHSVGTFRLFATTLMLLGTFVLWGMFLDGRIKAEEVISASMAPTIRTGDRLVSVRAGGGAIERGEIVIIEVPSQGPLPLIKRVAAIPGDTVLVLNNQVFVNRKPTKSEAIERGAWPVRAFAYYRLKPDEYFVLGDNRGNSVDSVYFGPVQRSQITGKALFRYAPLNRAGAL